MTTSPLTGLSADEVLLSRRQYGSNVIRAKTERTFVHVLTGIVTEPMFIMLLVACTIYFAMHQYEEGVIMLIAICIVAGISFFQEYRSRNAVKALQQLSAPKANVVRNGQIAKIATEAIVVNDLLWLEEGEIVAADGTVVNANDFSVNESIVTGESFAVYKDPEATVYKGTLVTSGSATVRVTAIGDATTYGRIGTSLSAIQTVKTPLQIQIKAFVQRMVWFGIVAFVIVFGINYYQSHLFVYGLLQGLTLAMSALPEEIPVAFSTFQALGAYRLLQNSIIVKQPQFVETLGSATVICLDKTGTLTQNKMRIAAIYDAADKKTVAVQHGNALPQEVVEYAMWASETTPFDPMEKAIHQVYATTSATDKRPYFTQVHEYPISGKPPMMTHVFKDDNGVSIIAGKGAPEAILQLSKLPLNEQQPAEEQVSIFARQGYRVLAVGKGAWHNENYPVTQQEFTFEFLGLIAFSDPPKPHIKATISTFAKAGIGVKIITGDYAETTLAIAKEIGLVGTHQYLTGKEIMDYSQAQLQHKVKNIHIFTRMFPEAKMKVIDALKATGEIVAMTGDGVNDAPALKAAHTGIAMGQRGSEVSKAAASLIITDDDLSHMVDAIALGRKIYDNLKKAIQYIVSIHIPIILIVTVPLLLQWKYPNLFSPVHVIFLELLMGPTCSIIYENEPLEQGTMNRPPRNLGATFLSARQLRISIVQGLMITVACLGFGYYCIQQGQSEAMVRTVVFITLLFSNIFLTLVNRSFSYSVLTTLRYNNYLVPLIVGITLLFIALVLYVPLTQQLFALIQLPFSYLFVCIMVALLCTMWIELFKAKAAAK